MKTLRTLELCLWLLEESNGGSGVCAKDIWIWL